MTQDLESEDFGNDDDDLIIDYGDGTDPYLGAALRHEPEVDDEHLWTTALADVRREQKA